MQQTNEPRQCMIIQDKQTLVLPQHGIPDFLKNRNKEMCQIRDSNSKALRCGNTGVSIKSECVCSFFNVYEGTYHSYSSCPGNVKSDDVRLLRCIDCVKYSLPNKGPCINGGNLTCKETGPDVKAPDIKCDCPPGFMGMFCENKMEKVTRICDRIENASTHNLKNCDVTKMDCITYSERKEYSFKCSEKSATTQQGQITLPLCSETEMHHTSLPNTVVTIDSAVNNRRRQPNPQYISGGKAMTSTLSITLFNVYALLQI
ncbi:uncharacterized protein LOC133205960 [Saccostrea echinata]|uniref:uncharacterized protein LOC133205960 n=1 Tax=Saccostrea echinata TaxID=191078 RepID=UPI002A7FC50E|nr:uncharacterized protein LOC133205960 [Saccostrea echinata]